LIFNWECSGRELRVHDPATAEQHGLKEKGIESAPSVGPCFGSTVSIREFSITPLAGTRAAGTASAE